MRRSTRGAWRNRVIKHLLHRTITFQKRAKNKEELEAWIEVEKWFRTIMRRQYENEKGVLVLPEEVGVPNE